MFSFHQTSNLSQCLPCESPGTFRDSSCCIAHVIVSAPICAEVNMKSRSLVPDPVQHFTRLREEVCNPSTGSYDYRETALDEALF